MMRLWSSSSMRSSLAVPPRSAWRQGYRPVGQHLGDDLLVDYVGESMPGLASVALDRLALKSSSLCLVGAWTAESPSRCGEFLALPRFDDLALYGRISRGTVMRRTRMRAPASSMRSIALSGDNGRHIAVSQGRCATTAWSVMVTRGEPRSARVGL